MQILCVFIGVEGFFFSNSERYFQCEGLSRSYVSDFWIKWNKEFFLMGAMKIADILMENKNLSIQKPGKL